MRAFKQRLESLGLRKTRAASGFVSHPIRRTPALSGPIDWAERMRVAALAEDRGAGVK